MKNSPSLLMQLTELVKLDRLQSIDSKNSELYFQRALLLQKLGCHYLAMGDNRIRASIEGKLDIEYYNKEYKRTPTLKEISFEYQDERDEYYYKVLVNIISNDKLFFCERIDPLAWAYQSGNLLELGLLNLSLRCVNLSIKYLKDFPREQALAYVNKSFILNLVGCYEEGWKLYEKRWETDYENFKNPLKFSKPKWNGEKLTQLDTLLICSEQGVGDNIQFVRYSIYLKKQGLDVLVLNNEVVDNFLTFNLEKYGIRTVKNHNEENFTYWVNIMSLPYLCKTTLTNIPFPNAYLTTSLESLQKWKDKICSPRFKIGIVWRSGLDRHIRNIPVEIFSKLFAMNAEFYVLQKEVTKLEKDYLSKYSNVHLFEHDLKDFFDTAAMASYLDLIISIDTSVAHLSASMGKPTWILLNYKPDFRWLIEGDLSVWYKSVQLFRQSINYDWKYVITQVITSLKDISNRS